jgi:glycosyltransferase involved in cell wall biosynthesis
VGADSPSLRAEDLRVVAERLRISDKVLMLGRVASSDLAALYRRAALMVMPSIDETFGLTVLEAMHFGCPVVTSNLSSMAEVGGCAALMVDPLSVKEIADGLRRVLGNSELRRSMRAAGLERAAMFSKDRMIGKTVAVLESAAAAAVRHSSAR